MSNSTTNVFRELLAEVLAAKVKLPGDLRERIDAAITRGPGGPGRAPSIDRARVHALHAEGLSAAAIARELQVTRQGVARILKAPLPSE